MAPYPLAVLMLLSTAFLWAISPLYVKYFANYYDVWTQNAFRYATSAIFLLVVARLFRFPVFTLTRRQWGKALMVAAANIPMQTLFVLAFYFIYPSVASLVARVNIILICVLSFIFYRDERPIIRSPKFLAGCVLALTGVCIVVLGQDPEILERLEMDQRDFWIGIGIVVVWSFSAALYALSIKRFVRDVHPVVAFTNVSWMTAIGLVTLMLLFGDGAAIVRQGARPVIEMIIIGILCIAVGHTTYYIALRRVKVVIAMTISQITPVLICIFSAFVYGDLLSPAQIVGGSATLAGAWLASLAQAQVEPSNGKGWRRFWLTKKGV